MPKILGAATAALLSFGLGGCIGTAGVSTWEYRSGPGYETTRIQESRIQADPVQGLTHEACTSMSERQIAASGHVSGGGLIACRSE
ncbi:hypothetical protein [Microvirga splendida]|uniref:Lipoprotein n=1 Tax=Microvirga splendida TaxID=2795727 RepID=A0ABS0XXW8_9HYPH|nr:hypothetical protein [Microvirga splendida]MBJ6124902.1 hypothetical protein [Microvirga splendida]